MQPHSPKRGFTLIEMLVVVALTGIIGITIGSLIQYFYRSNSYVFQSASAINQARRGVTYVTSNVRESTYGDDGSYPIASVGTSTATFYADVDQDGGVERVRVYITDTTFYRGITNSAGSPPSYTGQTEAVEIMATNVRNGTSTPLFRYYDASGTELTGSVNLSQIASVSLTLKIDLNPNRAPDIYTLTGSARLRNVDVE